jgi:energy-coupling factor transporter ATP-binding protein EcfA2
MFGFVGPNGAGKTTAMRIILGVLEADAGPAPPSSLTSSEGTGASRRYTTSAMSPSPRTPPRSARAPPPMSWRPCATWSSGCCAGLGRSTSPPAPCGLLLPSLLPLTSWPPLASSRCRQAPAALVQRAKILLLAAEGVSNTEIGERLGISRPTVIAWRRRFAREGLAGLTDGHGPADPRPSGAPATPRSWPPPSPRRLRSWG